MRGILLVCALAAAAASSQDAQVDIVFSETFQDLSLPAWRGRTDPNATVSLTRGPADEHALTVSAQQRVNATLVASLPADKLRGRGVMLDVWRRAQQVRTGAEHYHNAKAMLSWKSAAADKPKYATTTYSDFYGTFGWERHRYVVEMPEDLEWAAVTIGLQGCSGTASWANLTVSVDPRFPNQNALERFLIREEREAYANIDPDDLTVKTLAGGSVQVFLGTRYVPRAYWSGVVRDAVLDAVPRVDPAVLPEGTGLAGRLAQAFQLRLGELESGLSELVDAAASDRTMEVAGLRARLHALAKGELPQQVRQVRVRVDQRRRVSDLVFGNNINTQNLSAPYDSEANCFDEEFLRRIRPMGITFLRYPGGCNADVFNWRDTIGPLEARKDLINYHNGTSRGTPRFGVDEYLRFCEEEGMTPIITTAFCKAHPSQVDPNDHPNGIRHPYVFDYLRSAPERVQLAADWVEYCNGDLDTPLGALRAEHGHPEPYRVKYWEVGNEAYGPDPTGSCTAEEYARAFPAYVQAMKARDPDIAVVMNGSPSMVWNETVLGSAGKHADAFQFHIYLTPRLGNYSRLEGQPHQISAGMRLADGIPAKLSQLEELMQKHLGGTLPVIISEFGMGNARNREFMTSVTSPVLVADMWRHLVESQLVLGANKWCLYSGYWFSQVQGPTSSHPQAPYYSRPEQIMHTIYARCRGPVCIPADVDGEAVRAVVFEREGSYGVVLISREAVDWQRVQLDLPKTRSGEAHCFLMTASHPFLGNENDHDLVRRYDMVFDYTPGQSIPVPANSVMGLLLPR